ncbi:DUF1294 domain-containing protein [Anaerosacchariphilus polymeriproducens]|uniref:DUF1294 domain-containing protein n=1 Tax=Anaerosacchariphilus polymeriproducens TaxID=1812858 RepID=A0A371AWU0_9FIRM|nr:DUF1294 domain-containing protein [Anaerosacchariphilus polymeriproducens]RDU23940.1 DUF1294 domain-containing protein [Anaerosacchariphilus polymeriproducens]
MSTNIYYTIIFAYLFGMNLTAFVSMKLDKDKARKHQWRIPEKTLFILALLGGSVGSIFGMRIFHHKTKHLHFIIGMPIILFFQILLLSLLFFSFTS